MIGFKTNQKKSIEEIKKPQVNKTFISNVTPCNIYQNAVTPLKIQIEFSKNYVIDTKLKVYVNSYVASYEIDGDKLFICLQNQHLSRGTSIIKFVSTLDEFCFEDNSSFEILSLYSMPIDEIKQNCIKILTKIIKGENTNKSTTNIDWCFIDW